MDTHTINASNHRGATTSHFSSRPRQPHISRCRPFPITYLKITSQQFCFIDFIFQLSSIPTWVTKNCFFILPLYLPPTCTWIGTAIKVTFTNICFLIIVVSTYSPNEIVCMSSCRMRLIGKRLWPWSEELTFILTIISRRTDVCVRTGEREVCGWSWLSGRSILSSYRKWHQHSLASNIRIVFRKAWFFLLRGEKLIFFFYHLTQFCLNSTQTKNVQQCPLPIALKPGRFQDRPPVLIRHWRTSSQCSSDRNHLHHRTGFSRSRQSSQNDVRRHEHCSHEFFSRNLRLSR